MNEPGEQVVAVIPAPAENPDVDADTVVPEHERFGQAVAWLLDQPERSFGNIEAASQRFGLSPLESAVLFRYFSPLSPVNKDQ